MVLTSPNIEQCCTIKFLYQTQQKRHRYYKKLGQVHGGNALSKVQIFHWLKRLFESCEVAYDEPHSGKPFSVKTNKNLNRVRHLARLD